MVIVASTPPVAAMNSSKGRAATPQWDLQHELSEGHFRNTPMHINITLPIWLDRQPNKTIRKTGLSRPPNRLPPFLVAILFHTGFYCVKDTTATLSTLNLSQSSTSPLKKNQKKEEDMLTLKIHSFQQTLH